MQLARFDPAAFLRDHWQQRPLLIRNPWSAWANLLEPGDLAGLACEEGVESRLVVQGRNGWTVEHGPFPEARFGQAARSPWTLLVQAVDHHVPDVAALVEPFRFIPDWRIDDVMVSYASDGGGVGPHFDQYDVFLVQGLGRRRWRIGAVCDAATPLLPHDELRLLAGFEPVEEWVLEPGDILYLPPRVAHDGVALGDDCMTYSIGFRAPSRSELIAHWSDHVLESLADDDRYQDPAVPVQANPGEISAEALARLQAMIAERMLDRDGFARWFGEYSSAPKYAEIDWSPARPVTVTRLRRGAAAGTPLCRNPASRFSFVRRESGGGLLLFVDGRSFDCAGAAAAFGERICAGPVTPFAAEWAGSPEVLELIAALFNQGSLAFEEPG